MTKNGRAYQALSYNGIVAEKDITTNGTSWPSASDRAKRLAKALNKAETDDADTVAPNRILTDKMYNRCIISGIFKTALEERKDERRGCY